MAKEALKTCICGEEVTDRKVRRSHSQTCPELKHYVMSLAQNPEVIREVKKIGIGATATKHQVSDSMLKFAMQQAGTLPLSYWKMGRKGKTLDELTGIKILELYKQGNGIDKIAKILGCTTYVVRKHLPIAQSAITASISHSGDSQTIKPVPQPGVSLTDEELSKLARMIIDENYGLKILLKEKEALIINLREELQAAQEKVNRRTAVDIHSEAVQRAIDAH